MMIRYTCLLFGPPWPHPTNSGHFGGKV